jgi:hypothetical protein
MRYPCRVKLIETFFPNDDDATLAVPPSHNLQIEKDPKWLAEKLH